MKQDNPSTPKHLLSSQPPQSPQSHKSAKKILLAASTLLFIFIGLASFFIPYLLSYRHSSPSPFHSASIQQIPTAYQGRIRPLESASQLWLSELYQRPTLKSQHHSAFHLQTHSASELLWNLHFLGHQHWDASPLFAIHYVDLKTILGLDPKSSHASYQQLHHAIFDNQETNLALMKQILPYFFLKAYEAGNNRSRSEKIELTDLSKGLWLTFQNNQIIILNAPHAAPWNFLRPGMVLADKDFFPVNENRKLAEATLKLLTSLQHYEDFKGENSPVESSFFAAWKELSAQKLPSKEMEQFLENQYPLIQRLTLSGASLKVLPSRYPGSEWFSLKALTSQIYDPTTNQLRPVPNFTPYSDAQFEAIRTTYLRLDEAMQQQLHTHSYRNDLTLSHNQKIQQLADQLAEQLLTAYTSIAEKPYQAAVGKTLFYPSLSQLKIEVLYYSYPLIEIAILLYLLAALFISLSFSGRFGRLDRWGIGFLSAAFCLHTALLAIRCYVLQRPPVSNMFETVIYVPWITVLASMILWCIWKSRILLLAASLSSAGLLLLLKITDLNSGMENVQAVLDSRYWLMIHVLMIVGSYGIFILSGILGHFYLVFAKWRREKDEMLLQLGKLILQTMCIGLALLIPGTILGGVWAAESWGRFWDWDPKESWAFISSCIYLLWIHAFTFHRIGYFGLAVGSVIGLQAIGFTWYGVNYLLGTGFHTYGFGSGGEIYYYLFLLAEACFLTWIFFWKFSKSHGNSY